jgi:hypothetical protein
MGRKNGKYTCFKKLNKKSKRLLAFNVGVPGSVTYVSVFFFIFLWRH